MIFPWFSNDFLMIFQWFSHHFLIIFSSFSHEFSGPFYEWLCFQMIPARHRVSSEDATFLFHIPGTRLVASVFFWGYVYKTSTGMARSILGWFPWGYHSHLWGDFLDWNWFSGP
jgi:hypothetical protein